MKKKLNVVQKTLGGELSVLASVSEGQQQALRLGVHAFHTSAFATSTSSQAQASGPC